MMIVALLVGFVVQGFVVVVVGRMKIVHMIGSLGLRVVV